MCSKSKSSDFCCVRPCHLFLLYSVLHLCVHSCAVFNEVIACAVAAYNINFRNVLVTSAFCENCILRSSS